MHFSICRLSNNCLKTLPDDLPDANDTLIRLDISGNPMPKIPAVVMRMDKLKKLYIQNMLLTELPENMGDLAALTLLVANGNCLQTLPSSFAKLSKLEYLSLNGVAWCENRQENYLSHHKYLKHIDHCNLTKWFEEHPQVNNYLLYIVASEIKDPI